MMPTQGLMAPAQGQDEQENEQGPEGMDEQGGQGEEAPVEAATPQEEAQFNALMQPVTDALHGKGSQATLDRLKAGAKDLAGTIGEMAAQMIMSVEQKILKGGGKIEDAIKLQVGQEIVIDLIEIAEAAGLVDETDEAKGALFKSAMLNAIGAYGDMAAKAGLIDRGQAKQMLAQMVQGNDNPIAKNVASMLQQQGGQPQ